jgi:hypothetical protein
MSLKQERTRYPGVYVSVSKDGPRYMIRFRDPDGASRARTLPPGSGLEDAVRAREEILGRVKPRRGALVGDYLDPYDVQEIIDRNSSAPCVYVAQRKIAPYIVKIGRSTWRGVGRRMSDERLHLLLAIPGDGELERLLHTTFDAYQCDLDGQEFFFLTKEIRRWIDERRQYFRGKNGVNVNGECIGDEAVS